MAKIYAEQNDEEKAKGRIAKQNWRQLNKLNNAQLNIWLPQLMMKNLKLDSANKQIKVAELVRNILMSHGYGEEKNWDSVFAEQNIFTSFNNKEVLDAFPDDFMHFMETFDEK